MRRRRCRSSPRRQDERPVARSPRTVSTISGRERRRAPGDVVQLHLARVAEPSVSMSTHPSMLSTTARTVRVVCLNAESGAGCKGRSLIQHSVASSAPRVTGCRWGRRACRPRGTSDVILEADRHGHPGRRLSRRTPAVSIDATRVRRPDGSTPARRRPRPDAPATDRVAAVSW